MVLSAASTRTPNAHPISNTEPVAASSARHAAPVFVDSCTFLQRVPAAQQLLHLNSPASVQRIDAISESQTSSSSLALHSAAETWAALRQLPPASEAVTDVPTYYEKAPCQALNVLQVQASKQGKAQNQLKTIHANRMQPHPDQSPFILAQVPHTPDSVWEHWHSIFDHKADVIEIVEPRTKSTVLNPEYADFGLNFIHNAMLDGGMPEIHIGQYNIRDIQELPEPTHPASAQLRERQFNLVVQHFTSGETQNIHYRILEPHFVQHLYPAETLNAMIQFQNHDKVRWVASQTGVARPAAFLVADAIAEDIKAGDIKNTHELHCNILTYVQRGRNIRGPYFIHKQEQLEELYRFGYIKLGLEQARTKPHFAAEESKANIENYPMRWLPHRSNRTNMPVGQAIAFRPDDRVTSFQTIIGKLRGALYI